MVASWPPRVAAYALSVIRPFAHEGPPMKPAHVLTVALLLAIAAAHVLRLLLGWEVVVNRVTIAMWPSVIAIIVTLGLAVALWREAHRPHRTAA